MGLGVAGETTVSVFRGRRRVQYRTVSNQVLPLGYWWLFVSFNAIAFAQWPQLMNVNAGTGIFAFTSGVPDWYDGSAYWRPVNPWAFLYAATTTEAAVGSQLPNGELVAVAGWQPGASYGFPFNGAGQRPPRVLWVSTYPYATDTAELNNSTGNGQYAAVRVQWAASLATAPVAVGSVGFTAGAFGNSAAGQSLNVINMGNAAITGATPPVVGGLGVATQAILNPAMTVNPGELLAVTYRLAFGRG